MCNKAVDSYLHASEFVHECYKTQRMCHEAVDTYHSKIKFVLECYKTQEMCNKAVHKCLFGFGSIPNQYRTQ